MEHKRQRVQFGWLDLKKRKNGPEVWVLRYRETLADGSKRVPSLIVGSITEGSRPGPYGRFCTDPRENGSGMCSNICRNSSPERDLGSRFRFEPSFTRMRLMG
jgi:hypothetical protein